MRTTTLIPETEYEVLKGISKTVNILLVDDRPENLVSLESILEGNGRFIMKALSGNEALKLSLENEIALILLDVQMPEMDGFEVARLLKENSKTREISIIFVTAINKEEKYTMQGYEEGAVDYLHKPLDINIVKAKVNVFEQLYRRRLELKEANEKLTNINKQLDEFVYIVSHDLKAPLRGLSSLSDFIQDEIGTDVNPGVNEMLAMMKSRTARMQQLVDGILHYSRMGNTRTQKEPVDVKELINNILDLIPPPPHIRIELPDNLPRLVAERIKLHEVFQNLIVNAFKYNNRDAGFLKITCNEFSGHFSFSVIDNGNGIKPEHLEKIFGIFQTLQSKDNSESTGIGLTIVKKIVEQQGGKITVSSVFGEGSTFQFTWKK